MSTALERPLELPSAAVLGERLPGTSAARPERVPGQLPAVVLRLPDVSPQPVAPGADPAAEPALLKWLRANVRFVAFMVVGVAIILWLLWGNRPAPSKSEELPSAPAWNSPADDAPAADPAGPQFPRHTPVPTWKTSRAAAEDTLSGSPPAWPGGQPQSPLAAPATAAAAGPAPPSELRTARAVPPDTAAAPRFDGSASQRPPTARLQNVIVKPNSTDDGRAGP